MRIPVYCVPDLGKYTKLGTHDKNICLRWICDCKLKASDKIHKYTIRIDTDDYYYYPDDTLMLFRTKLSNIDETTFLNSTDLFDHMILHAETFTSNDIENHGDLCLNIAYNVHACVNFIRRHTKNNDYYTYNNFINNLATYLEKYNIIELDASDSSLLDKLKVFMSPTLRLETGPDGELNKYINRIDLLSYRLKKLDYKIAEMQHELKLTTDEKESVVEELNSLKEKVYTEKKSKLLNELSELEEKYNK